MDNLRPFIYQNLSVIDFKYLSYFSMLSKYLRQSFLIHDKLAMHLFTYVPLYLLEVIILGF